MDEPKKHHPILDLTSFRQVQGVGDDNKLRGEGEHTPKINHIQWGSVNCAHSLGGL